MDKHYWNRAAEDYEREILDSINTDRSGVIQRRLWEYANPNHIAADFGCGVGKYLPDLAGGFKAVYAIDHAVKLLERAIASCGQHNNIRFIVSDLARRSIRMRRAHFAVCANVLIMPDDKRRAAILRNVREHMTRRGHLMLLIASTESALFANQRLLTWNRRCGISRRAARRQAIQPTFEALDGVIDREDVAHKHYLREEAIVMLDETGFDTLSVDRVEYPWQTEFENPPKWMAAPYPWDWLIVARKR